jgi:hypothetical protein
MFPPTFAMGLGPVRFRSAYVAEPSHSLRIATVTSAWRGPVPPLPEAARERLRTVQSGTPTAAYGPGR